MLVSRKSLCEMPNATGVTLLHLPDALPSSLDALLPLYTTRARRSSPDSGDLVWFGISPFPSVNFVQWFFWRTLRRPMPTAQILADQFGNG